jgi:hypothetical protein
VHKPMLQAFAAGTLVMLSASIAVAQQLPTFNLEETCRAAHPLGPEDRDPYQGCMKDEGAARNELQRQWMRFEAGNRDLCAEETRVGGYPSYVEVLTCLQMFSGTPTTPLKPRRRGD